jgi:hypothetical protein
MAGINYTALMTEPAARDVAVWRESVRKADQEAGRHGPASDAPAGQAPAWVGVATILGLGLLVLFLSTGLWLFFAEGETVGLAISLTLGVVLTGAVAGVYRRRVTRLAEGWHEPFQLMKFAHDNGFAAVPVTGPADLPGRIFGRGLAGNRVRHDLVAFTHLGRQVEVATESWNSGLTAGGGEPEDAGTCRYLAVDLGVTDLPHLQFRTWQDQFSTMRGAPHVQLQVPPGSEEVATAIFNDEVLRWLTAPEQPRQAEVIGGWFLAYDLKPSDPLDVTAWERTFALVDALPMDIPRAVTTDR